MRLTVVQGRTGSKGTGRLNKEQQNVTTQRWHYDQRTKKVDSFCLKKLRYTDQKENLCCKLSHLKVSTIRLVKHPKSKEGCVYLYPFLLISI